MRITNPFMFVLLLCFIGCATDNNSSSQRIQKEVSSLQTDESKKAFLKVIFDDDQAVRNEESDEREELTRKYGKDSPEYKEYERQYTEEQWRQDKIDLEKVDAYLKEYGYPDPAILGENAALVPWLVIHHTGGVEVRNSYFEILYESYLNEYINEPAMGFYLDRTHFSMGGKSMYTNISTAPKDQLDKLIEELNLGEKRDAVLERWKRERSL